MNAWMPGTATYTPFRFPVATAGQNIGPLRQWMVERATVEMKATPTEWRWSREGDDILVVAAKEE